MEVWSGMDVHPRAHGLIHTVAVLGSHLSLRERSVRNEPGEGVRMPSNLEARVLRK
jgi:uncharacterized phosphosugar-binding protein